ALPVHDIETSLFGTSLGVDIVGGVGVNGGHQHHVRAINAVRAAGSIEAAVRNGIVTGGVMYECVEAGIPYVLAGSIRDDGPLPETLMDLVAAQSAYALAGQAFDKDGVNRVILATDGDFNIGISNADDLKRFIEEKRKTGIFLSVLGFGYGNLNDGLMQALAQNGNGNAAYIDTLREAQKVLVEEAGSTLFPIARDVKIQVEFNPAMVAEYRLIGYETRALRREDFNNDKVDAGDIGSGHTVTAIYEITPAGAARTFIDGLRYGSDAPKPSAGKKGEYAHLKLRYKLPKGKKSKRMTVAITTAHDRASIAKVSGDMRFAAGVAAFGQKLRGETHLEDMSYDAIRKLARSGRGADPYGRRAEFLSLIGLARSMGESAVAARN
ncbi:MAG: YfbK domain-containing protein, partial [Hyphomicrobiales bacterium]